MTGSMVTKSDQSYLTVFDRAVLLGTPEYGQVEAFVATYEGLSQIDDGFSEADKASALQQADATRRQFSLFYDPKSEKNLERRIKELQSDPQQAAIWARTVVEWAKIHLMREPQEESPSTPRERDLGLLLTRLDEAKVIFYKNEMREELGPVYALISAVETLSDEIARAERHSEKAERFIRIYGLPTGRNTTSTSQAVIAQAAAQRN